MTSRYPGALLRWEIHFKDADLYNDLAQRLDIQVLKVYAGESLYFDRYITPTADGYEHSEDMGSFGSMQFSFLIGGERRTDEFLLHHGRHYEIDGPQRFKDLAQFAVREERRRARNGARNALIGAGVAAASFAFDFGYVDDALLAVGSLTSFLHAKHVVNYVRHKLRG